MVVVIFVEINYIVYKMLMEILSHKKKHGVFKFILDYKRVGYSYILSITKIPSKTSYHNE